VKKSPFVAVPIATIFVLLLLWLRLTPSSSSTWFFFAAFLVIGTASSLILSHWFPVVTTGAGLLFVGIAVSLSEAQFPLPNDPQLLACIAGVAMLLGPIVAVLLQKIAKA
jgi:hypothetical protein